MAATSSRQPKKFGCCNEHAGGFAIDGRGDIGRLDHAARCGHGDQLRADAREIGLQDLAIVRMHALGDDRPSSAGP